MKRFVNIIFSGLFIIAMCAAMLAGCENSGGTSGNADGTARDVQSQPKEQLKEVEKKEVEEKPLIGLNLKYDPNVTINEDKPITVTFWTQMEYEVIYKKWLEDYSSIHPNVKFEVVSNSYDDHYKKLHVALKSGTGPDFFHMHNSFNSMLISGSEPYPEDIFPIDKLNADFRRVDECVNNGKIYYINTGFMTSGIFYNKALWAEAGLTEKDIPKTWDKLVEVAVKLTKTDETGKITQAGFNVNGISQCLLMAMNLQKGQRLFGSDGKTPKIDTEITRDNLKFISDLYNTKNVCSIKLPMFNEALLKNKAAMIYSWSWVANVLKTSAPGMEFGFFPLPSFDGNIPPAYDRNNGEVSMVVSKLAPNSNKKVAFDAIKFFLASDEYLADIDVVLGIAPSKYTLDKNQKIVGNQTISSVAKILDRTVWPGAYPLEYEKTMSQYLTDEVIVKNSPIDQAVAKAALRAKHAMELTNFVSLEDKYKYASEFGK